MELPKLQRYLPDLLILILPGLFYKLVLYLWCVIIKYEHHGRHNQN